MKRLLATIKTDVRLQYRNRLYTIGIFVGAVIAVGLSQLAGPEHFSMVVPVLMLIVVGGTTMLYVAGMIIFERDEGTLNMLLVTPLRSTEYLWSKIITLTALATLESVIMIGGALLIMKWNQPIRWPNVPILIAGIVSIGVIYTLIGLILVVRYQRITDFLLPMAGVAVVLQLPFLHFLGMVEHPAMLLIPTSAPTMLMQGAFVPLQNWEWVYGTVYTAIMITVLTAWAYRGFHKHVVDRGE